MALSEEHPAFEFTCDAESALTVAETQLEAAKDALQSARIYDLPEEEREVQELALRQVLAALEAVSIARDAMLSTC